jgi:hypothetical protein
MSYSRWSTLLAFPVLVLAAQAFGQADKDPAIFCKANPKDMRCVVYLGGQSTFSGTGNVGSAVQGTLPTTNRYNLFIHDDGGPAELSDRIAKTLRAKGFEVRGTDRDADLEGGPGVDYFYEGDEAAARAVAEIANSMLPADRKKLVARKQSAKNPPGFLGVWLYEKSR